MRRTPLVPVAFCLPLLAACGGGGGNTGPTETTPAAQERAAGQLASSASIQFEQQVASHAADPVGALVTSLRSDQSVATVDRYDADGSVIVTLKTGLSFGIEVAEKNRSEWAAASPSPPAAAALITAPHPGHTGEFLKAPIICRAITCDSTNYPQSKKACVVQGFQGEFQQNTGPITSSLTRAGFTVSTYSLKTSADLFNLEAALSTCGVLYISSHGIREKNLDGNFGNHIVTEIEVPQDQAGFDAARATLFGHWSNARQVLGMTGHNGKSYFTISPDFFAGTKYPNTLVVADACGSDEDITPVQASGGSQLRDAFRQNGAGAFVGWKGPVSTKLSEPAVDTIFSTLAPKVANITGVSLTVTPPNPPAFAPYVPSATIAPAAAGVEVQLSVRGTDGFTRDETKTTDATGKVTFSSVPGGASGVKDVVTVSVGGASNSQTAFNAVENNPGLQKVYKLPWSPADGSISKLSLTGRSSDFNIVCNNQALVQTQTFVQF